MAKKPPKMHEEMMDEGEGHKPVKSQRGKKAEPPKRGEKKIALVSKALAKKAAKKTPKK